VLLTERVFYFANDRSQRVIVVETVVDTQWIENVAEQSRHGEQQDSAVD
jgi:hypothetical protein